MQLTIHDAHLKKVAFIDNEKPKTLNFYDDTWTRNLQTGSSTYEFSISKKQLVSDTVLERTYNYLNERSFVSFEYKGKTYLFNVMTVEEDEKKIKCYCENLNLELINEYSNAYEADRAMTFVEYCNAMDLLNMPKLSLGINEISDYKRTLKWEGQDTKLARLISLANKFDAEIDFETFLNADSTIKSFLVNVYHENDGNFHGVGRVRKDITLVYGKNLKSIKRKIDKTGIFNMIVPSSQNEENSDQKLTIKDLPDWEIKNDAGVVEYFKKGAALYAPISAQLYPSTFTSETQSDQWIRHDTEFDVKSAKQLETEGLKQLKASAYPELTYEFDGYIDADIGDTVQISDSGFTNMLLLEARIFEQKLSFASKKNWKTTLGNFKALQNMLSSDIQAELEKLVDDAKPYTIRVSSDNGITFKNGEGKSLIKATLWKGNKVLNTDVTWRWALDGNVTVAMEYLAKASTIKDTAVLTVSAYVGNNEVATTEITLTNVNDGADGVDGNDGLPGKDGVGLKSTVVTYGLSTSETTQPTSWTAQVPTLTKGKYLWTKTVWTYTNNTSETGYQKTYIAKDGNDGNDGLPGKDGVGIKSTTITYASSTSGTTKPTSGWSSAIPSVSAGNYLWTKTVWTYTDNTSETGYSVAKMGETGAKGDKGDDGAKGDKGETGNGIANTVITYGLSTSETTEPATWASNMPVLVKGMYLWTRTVQIYTNGKSTTSYQKGYIAKDGAQGLPGTPGKDAQTQYTHIAYADNATGGGFSLTDNTKPYWGMYQDFNAANSNDPTKYKWSKWKGDQGLPGAPGADGKTPYIHFAYADDNKGTNLSFTDKNQQYQGYYSDYTEANSSDYKKYTWVDRLANVQVGTRNLWIQSKATGGFVEEILPDNHITGQKKCYRIPNNKELAFNIEPDFSSRLYQKVTFSAWVKYENVVQGANSWNMFNCFKHAMLLKNSSTGATSNTQYTTLGNFTGTSDWKYITYTYDYAANKSYDQLKTIIRFNLEGAKSGNVWVTGVMVQFGNVATGHVWAPEDVQADIDSKADSALTQEQLNALAEQDNLIKAEMEAKASIDTVDKWITAYENYVKANDADKAKSEQALKEASERILKIRYEVNDLKFVWDAIDRFMSFQNEGLVIGKKDGSAYAKFSDDRISLFSGSSEVMYISQGTLNIANGIFTKTIQIGRFRFETHPADVDMLVLRYLGG